MICTSDPNILISSLVFSEKVDKMCTLLNKKNKKKTSLAELYDD
jgi:hypothetical protein